MAKRVSNEELARMVQRGFAEVDKKLETIRAEMATKDDLQRVKEELTADIQRRAVKAAKGQASLHDWVRDIDERLTALEGKRKRRAA